MLCLKSAKGSIFFLEKFRSLSEKILDDPTPGKKWDFSDKAG